MWEPKLIVGLPDNLLEFALGNRQLRLGSGDNVTVLLVQFDVPDPAP